MITDPVQALERIAFLLERAAQPSRRIEALRTAAAVLRRFGPQEPGESRSSAPAPW